LAVVERLIKKGEEICPPKNFASSPAVRLSEDFEEKAYPQVGNSPTPRDVPAFLMEQQGLKQKDLADIFSQPGLISQVLRGAREISKAEAEALAEKFRVSAGLFV